MLGTSIVPSIVQSLKVTPNEINLETPYIENNINNFHILGYKNVKEVYKYHKLADILLLPLKGSKYISKTISIISETKNETRKMKNKNEKRKTKHEKRK